MDDQCSDICRDPFSGFGQPVYHVMWAIRSQTLEQRRLLLFEPSELLTHGLSGEAFAVGDLTGVSRALRECLNHGSPGSARPDSGNLVPRNALVDGLHGAYYYLLGKCLSSVLPGELAPTLAARLAFGLLYTPTGTAIRKGYRYGFGKG